MASIKIKCKFPVQDAGKGLIYYSLVCNRQVKRVPTSYELAPEEWDPVSSQVLPASANEKRREYLILVQEWIAEDVRKWKRCMAFLEERQGTYTPHDLLEVYAGRRGDLFFCAWMRRVMAELSQLDKPRTSEAYASALNSFSTFRQHRDVLLDEVDAHLMLAYEAWLQKRGVSFNTISFYMRILRAVYNRAVAKELMASRSPFKRVYTGNEKTLKRAVPLSVVRKLKDLDLSPGSASCYARDMFLFSFYTRGMSFVDMAFLKKSDLQSGCLAYRRKKTGQQLFIRWEPCMQEIVDRYSQADSPYLLSIIQKWGEKERRQYLTEAHRINRHLKELGKSLGLLKPLTMYVARHAWASIARSKRVPISVISECMGHDSETTTQIYLASLDNSLVDKANQMILNSL